MEHGTERADFPAAAPIYRMAGIRVIEQRFIRQFPLMERAGAAATEVAQRLLPASGAPVAILCGPGNNGGDGFVVARRLSAAGHAVTVVFAGDPARLPEDARATFEAYRVAGGSTTDTLPESRRFALAVDALFGIGLARAIEGRYAEWIAWLNAADCPVLAIDIPSGLDADTGRRLGSIVNATHTATFIALKPGLLTLDGPDHCGEISVHELDLAPGAVVEAEGRTVTPGLFSGQLRPRPRNSHKGMMGDAGIVGGAAGMVGAALLAGRAALKLGAGRVFVGMLAEQAPAVDLLAPELMLRDAEQVVAIASALAVGPGLGRSEPARMLLEAAAAREAPLVLDADALNLVAGHPELARSVSRRDAPTLMTPHPAEAGRLLGCPTADVQADRVAAAQALARTFNAFAALKGCGTVIAAPDGKWSINTSGNPGMASAGMGDVLTGMAAAFLAQGWPAEAALRAAVHLHGAAADRLAAAGDGPVGLAAGELIESARTLLNGWIGRRF